MRALQKRKKSARIVFSATMLRCAALPRSRDKTFPFCSSLLMRRRQAKPRAAVIDPFDVRPPCVLSGNKGGDCPQRDAVISRLRSVQLYTARGGAIEAAKGAESDVNFHRPCRTVCLFRNKEAWKPSQGIFETASMLCGARNVSMLFNVADLWRHFADYRFKKAQAQAASKAAPLRSWDSSTVNRQWWWGQWVPLSLLPDPMKKKAPGTFSR